MYRQEPSTSSPLKEGVSRQYTMEEKIDHMWKRIFNLSKDVEMLCRNAGITPSYEQKWGSKQ